MIDQSLAHRAHESTSYVDKGRALFEEEFDSFQYLGRGRWLLPSATTPGRHYKVSTRGEGSCECLGWWHHRHCCHQVAADLARLKLLFLYFDHLPIQEPLPATIAGKGLDWTLAFFLGEKVCQQCAGDHGLL